MGKTRKDSDRFKIERLQKPEAWRETLVPCEACGGHGFRNLRKMVFDGTRYRYAETKISCNWCKGDGSVTKKLAIAFHRWMRILRHNRAAGTCPKE